MKFKFVSLLLALCTAAGSMALPAAAETTWAAQAESSQPDLETNGGAENVWEDFAYQVLDDQTIEITRYTGSDDILIIPEKIEERQISAIGAEAFRACKTLKEITLPQGMTSIGKSAFAECESLENITLPQGLTSIGNAAFLQCSSLKAVDLPDGVTAINDYTFGYCENLERVSIPESVTTIREAAFGQCLRLKTIAIPKGVTSLADYAFYHCESLERVEFSDNITYIGENAFAYCKSLDTLTLPDRLANIDFSAFARCESLKDLVFSENLETIGEQAFIGCKSLKDLKLPEGLQRIGEEAFANCSKLKSLALPVSVKEIAKGAFSGCSKLKTVEYNGSKTKRKKIWIIGEGNIPLLQSDLRYANNGKTETFAPKKGARITSGNETYQVKTDVNTVAFVKTNSKAAKFTVPDFISVDGITYKVASVTKDAFRNNKKITKVTIKAEITSLGKNAFRGCSNLGTIEIRSRSLSSVGADAFRGIQATATMKVPNGKQNAYQKLIKGKGIGSKVKVVS